MAGCIHQYLGHVILLAVWKTAIKITLSLHNIIYHVVVLVIEGLYCMLYIKLCLKMVVWLYMLIKRDLLKVW